MKLSKNQQSIKRALEVMGHYPGYIAPEERKAIEKAWKEEAENAGLKNSYIITKNNDWGFDSQKITIGGVYNV